MTAYYNEIDLYCAEWLRNLMREGLIADGHVDTRSIADVTPNDLAGFTQCHFFAGLGGWSGALRFAAWPDHRPVWTGSCPCQPFSLAGRQGGFADERHLWPSFRYHIAQRRPPVVFGEQVASATEWLGLVRGDLEKMGYAVGTMPIQAASAGADHLRDRYWFVADADADADADDAGSQGRRVLSECAGERIAGADGLADADSVRGEVYTDARGSADGSGARTVTGPGGACDGDGLADSHQLSACEERQQRSREFCGTGCDPQARDGRDLADAPCDGAGDAARGGDRAQGSSIGIDGNASGASAPAGINGANSDVGLSDSGGRAPRQQAAAPSRHGDSVVSAGGDLEWVIGADGKARRVKPGIRLLAHGVPNRVAKLRALGNAIDLRPAAAFIKAVMD